MSDIYVVKSGSGYVGNRYTLEMIGGHDDTLLALEADRMSLPEAIEIYDEMSSKGMDVTIMKLVLVPFDHIF